MAEGEGCSSWNVLVARPTADTEHFQGADCKLWDRDPLSFRPAGVLLLYPYSLRLLGVSVARMGGDYGPLSALKCVSELPAPGPAVSMARDFFLCDGHS